MVLWNMFVELKFIKRKFICNEFSCISVENFKKLTHLNSLLKLRSFKWHFTVCRQNAKDAVSHFLVVFWLFLHLTSRLISMSLSILLSGLRNYMSQFHMLRWAILDDGGLQGQKVPEDHYGASIGRTWSALYFFSKLALTPLYWHIDGILGKSYYNSQINGKFYLEDRMKYLCDGQS